MVLTHVTNTITNTVSTFEQWAYNGYMCIGDKYYATSSSGLVQIDSGTTDNGVEIQALVETGDSALGSQMIKRVGDFYIAMRADGDATLSVYVDEVLIGSYVLSPQAIETLKQRRALIGKGARGKYWRFSIASSNDFDFDAFVINAYEMSRRI